MRENDISNLTKKVITIFSELGPFCGQQLKLISDSIIAEGPYYAASALSFSNECEPSLVRHTVLAKLFIAENADEPQEWVLLFHYLNEQLVAPTGLHHMRMIRTKGPSGTEWRSMGWETDEYDEWSDLTHI